MTKPTVELADDLLSVFPGERMTTTLRLRNPSALVGEFKLSIPSYCDASNWVTFRQVVPVSGKAATSISVSFLPSLQEAEVEVAFEPPAIRTTPTGVSHFVIAVDAQEQKNESTTVEGRLDVCGQPAIDSRLFGGSAKGRTQGRYRVGVANTGNVPLKVRLAGDYDTERSALAWAPDELALRPGGKNEFLVELRTRRPKPAGKAEMHEAILTPKVTVPAGEVPTIQSHTVSFEQRPWVPTVLIPIVALAVAAGVFFALPSVGGDLASSEPAPDPPTELTHTPSPDRVIFNWAKDEQAIQTRVAIVACDTATESEPEELVSADFDDATGELDISTLTTEALCFRARSIGSTQNLGIWGPSEGPFTRPSDELAVPMNVTLDGDALSFEETGAPSYVLIINNRALPDTYTGSPVSLADLDLSPGLVTLRVQSADGDLRSGFSEEVAYEPVDESAGKRPSEAWILLFQSESDIDQSFVANIKSIVATHGGGFGERSQFVDLFQLAETDANGQRYQLEIGTVSLDIGGRFVIGDTGGGLSDSEAVDYCRTVLSSLNERIDENPEASQATTCVAYGSDSRQLTSFDD